MRPVYHQEKILTELDRLCLESAAAPERRVLKYVFVTAEEAAGLPDRQVVTNAGYTWTPATSFREEYDYGGMSDEMVKTTTETVYLYGRSVLGAFSTALIILDN